MSDQLPRQSATLVSSDWEWQRPVALCRDDGCPWKHAGITIAMTKLKAEDHVQESGHEVTIYHEERMTIGLLKAAPDA